MKSPAYDFLKIQWMLGNLSETQLATMVQKGYITEAEKGTILSTPKVTM